ncbi:MAG: hypothetical protein ACRD4L_07025 [Pyrinomonadaceae bacterium]
MWKQILEIAKRLFLVAQDNQRNRDEIKELHQEMRNLSRAVEHLAYEIHRVSDRDNNEREKIMLQLENELLRFERRLTSTEKPQ